MKKNIIIALIFLFTGITAYAQDSPPAKAENGNSEIAELKATRDTAKAELRRKKLENTKDNNHLLKLEMERDKLKDQLKSAKKLKKEDKVEATQLKIDENLQALKDLNTKLKEEDKELDQLEKAVKEAEKAYDSAKEKALKEKSKSK